MKAKEIEQHLAEQTLVAATNHFTPSDLPHCKPASIQAMRQPRKAYSGNHDWTGHTVHDGVQVQYDDGTTTILRPAEIVMTWDEYKVKLAERDERSRKAHDHREDQRLRAGRAVAALKTVADAEGFGGGYGSIESSVDAYGRTTIRLSITAAEGIIELLGR